MPFLSEAIYQQMPGRSKEMLMVEEWPSFAKASAGKPQKE